MDEKLTPREYSAWEVLQMLRNAADEKLNDDPDYVYKRPDEFGSCVNLETNENGDLVGSCLVGRMFVNLGVKPTETWSTGSAGYIAEDYLKPRGVTFTKEAMFVMTTAQNLQDGGVPWRHCLAAAEIALSHLGIATSGA